MEKFKNYPARYPLLQHNHFLVFSRSKNLTIIKSSAASFAKTCKIFE
jgi:hypothetical protein